MVDIELVGQSFCLLAQKAIFWKNINALLISDVHLGKATHFRKNGIQAPADLGEIDLLVIHDLLFQTQASKLFIIGDLFHSDLNNEWYLFEEFILQHPNVEFILIRGNHDGLPAYLLKQAQIKVKIQHECNGILLNHFPLKSDMYYVICGHIHPGIVLKGKGKQSLRLPCFYIGEKLAILPAFGNFTGLANIEPQKNDKIFVIANGSVIAL